MCDLSLCKGVRYTVVEIAHCMMVRLTVVCNFVFRGQEWKQQSPGSDNWWCSWWNFCARTPQSSLDSGCGLCSEAPRPPAV